METHTFMSVTMTIYPIQWSSSCHLNIDWTSTNDTIHVFTTNESSYTTLSFSLLQYKLLKVQTLVSLSLLCSTLKVILQCIFLLCINIRDYIMWSISLKTSIQVLPEETSTLISLIRNSVTLHWSSWCCCLLSAVCMALSIQCTTSSS